MLGRTVAIRGRAAFHETFAKALPAKMGRFAIRSPLLSSNPVQSEPSPARRRADRRGARSFPCEVAPRNRVSGFARSTAAFTPAAWASVAYGASDSPSTWTIVSAP